MLKAARRLSLAEFNEVVRLDEAAATLDVEGLTTYEKTVDYALARGFLPLVAPELKHITVGGATAIGPATSVTSARSAAT